jgi:hypothetical protein
MSGDALEAIALADFFENFQEQISSAGGAQQRAAVVTRTGDEMEMVRTLVAVQACGHSKTLEAEIREVCDERTRVMLESTAAPLIRKRRE